MIITLCGSTKFKKEYQKVNKMLTLAGHIVLSVGLFSHADKIKLTKIQKHLLDSVHFKKIDMSDAIYIIDKNSYIGESTKKEINYALNENKFICYDSDYMEWRKNNYNIKEII